MPFEHETKFVLRRNVTHQTLASLPGLTHQKSTKIKQLYMDDGMRIRDTSPLDPTQHGLIDPYRTVMTYKRRTNHGPVEIETEISDEDFNALAPNAERFLYKDRHVLHDEKTGLNLELDIFGLSGRPTVLVMLEVEHEAEDTERLDVIERMLIDADILTLRVHHKDSRFSNYKLAEIYYMIGLAAVVYGDYHLGDGGS